MAQVCPKCDDEAAAVDEDVTNKQEKNAHDVAAAKKILEEIEDVEIRRLIERRRNTARGERRHLKEVSKQIRKCIKDKKISKRQEKIQRILKEFRVPRTYPASNQRRRECLFPKLKTTKVIQSQREKGLQMSSANSTANYLQAMKLKKSFKIP